MKSEPVEKLASSEATKQHHCVISQAGYASNRQIPAPTARPPTTSGPAVIGVRTGAGVDGIDKASPSRPRSNAPSSSVLAAPFAGCVRRAVWHGHPPPAEKERERNIDDRAAPALRIVGHDRADPQRYVPVRLDVDAQAPRGRLASPRSGRSATMPALLTSTETGPKALSAAATRRRPVRLARDIEAAAGREDRGVPEFVGESPPSCSRHVPRSDVRRLGDEAARVAGTIRGHRGDDQCRLSKRFINRPLFRQLALPMVGSAQATVDRRAVDISACRFGIPDMSGVGFTKLWRRRVPRTAN